MRNPCRPYPRVNVVIPGSEPIIGTTTDINGEFILADIEVGRVDLRFTSIGYKPVYKRALALETGKKLYLEIHMTEKVEQLEEVLVKAELRKDRAINKMATVSARSFSVEETERYAGSLGDPSRMAQNFAGINTRNGSDLAYVNLSHLIFLNEKSRIRSYIAGYESRCCTRLYPACHCF